jgi:hypothetical protein
MNTKQVEAKLRRVTGNPFLIVCGKHQHYCPQYVISDGQPMPDGGGRFTQFENIHFNSLKCLSNWIDLLTVKCNWDKLNKLREFGFKLQVKAVYDNGGKTADRYTIVYNAQEPQLNRATGEYFLSGKDFMCVGSSMNPTHPQGFFQHSSCRIGRHLGKKINFFDLPDKVQNAVNNDLKD